ncbi:MAG: M14 family zinc carboxypeptidase [Candidatus Sericytochromatia bacterium]
MRRRLSRLQPFQQTALLATGTLLLGMGLASWAQSVPDLSRFRQASLAQAPALRSVQGRPLDLYRFGEGQDEIIVLLGGFHGDEVQGEYMLQRVMARLATEPELLTGRTIWCLPLVNPDGKQARRRGNARGVDLNRNFPTQNFIPAQHRGTRYYAGPKALSEPESQIVAALLAPYLGPLRPRVKILSIHAPLLVNNYDGPAQVLAEAMSRFNGLPATASIGYPTPGSFGTYYGKERQIPVVTLETGRESPQQAWKNHEKAVWAFIDTRVAPTPLPSATPSREPSPIPLETPLPDTTPLPGVSPDPGTPDQPESTASALPTPRVSSSVAPSEIPDLPDAPEASARMSPLPSMRGSGS